MSVFRRTANQSNRFLPQLEALEDRQLLSTAALAAALPPTTTGSSAPLPVASGFRTGPSDFMVAAQPPGSVFVPIGRLPRTGGAAFQEGVVLHVVLQTEPANTESTITDDGHGDVTAEWNGKPPHAFQGVRDIVIDSLGQQDVIHYNLTGDVDERHEKVVVRLASPSSQFIPDLGTFQSRRLDIDVEPRADEHGTLFQAGPVLFLALSQPAANQTSVVADGHGNITVEWDGHTRTFHGIRQIVIDSLGQQDTISFTLTGNVTRALEVGVQLANPGSSFTQNLGTFQTDGLTFDVQTTT